jgi:putative phosphoesterase
MASRYPALQLHGSLAELEFDQLHIAVNHYPEVAHALAKSGCYDLVCYGHTHTAHEQRIGDCLLLNPGELMGLYGKTTFAWFDTVTRGVQFRVVT